MYKRSDINYQTDMFSDISQHLQSKYYNQYNDKKGWHNLFREQVINQIDEDIFSVLYSKAKGRYNATIRVLIGMMILKEGFGWSDSELYSNCGFNLLVRNALGKSSLKDKIPVESTYYLFKQHLYEHKIETGEDLIDIAFSQITHSQAVKYEVNGKSIRMDSKLIGHNISNFSRIQLIIGVIQEFYKKLAVDIKRRLPESDKSKLDELIKSKATKITYRLDNIATNELFVELGNLMYCLVKLYNIQDSDYYEVLKTVFEQQYNISEESQIVLKDKKDITASSIQSPYDKDAEYRHKGGQSVKGSSINLTETANTGGLNLITSIQAGGATKSDSNFFQEAIEKTEKVTGKIENAHTDGAYNSKDNHGFCDKGTINFYHTDIQGKKGNFDFEFTDEGLEITDKRTGKKQVAEKRKDKYRITLSGGTYRYFTDNQIESYFRRKEVENFPEEIRNKRPNVEASIFQLSYYTRNNKTRYRGNFKVKIWAILRSLWINLVRIKNHIGKLCPVFTQTVKPAHLSLNLLYKRVFGDKFSSILFILYLKFTQVIGAKNYLGTIKIEN